MWQWPWRCRWWGGGRVCTHFVLIRRRMNKVEGGGPSLDYRPWKLDRWIADRPITRGIRTPFTKYRALVRKGGVRPGRSGRRDASQESPHWDADFPESSGDAYKEHAGFGNISSRRFHKGIARRLHPPHCRENRVGKLTRGGVLSCALYGRGCH